jgi:hypothetical protein
MTESFLVSSKKAGGHPMRPTRPPGAAETLTALDDLQDIPLTSHKRALERALERYREQAQRIETELERRRAGGRAEDHDVTPRPSPYETVPWKPEDTFPQDL